MLDTVQRSQWRRTLLDIADQVYAGDAGPPPGSLGRLFGVLDTIRATGARDSDVRYAEGVALGLHRLQQLLRTTGKQSPAVQAERTALHRSTLAWMQDTPLSDFA